MIASNQMFHPGNTQSKAKPVSDFVAQLLKSNHQNYHVFFSHPELSAHGVLLHNHIAHHILTLDALGASPETIKQHYEQNAVYQRNIPQSSAPVVAGMQDREVFERCLGHELQYGNFLQFFTREAQTSGYKDTVIRYLFADTAVATDMLARQFSGFVHPLLQTGFGLEFDVPELVLEGLAMGCSQNDELIRNVMMEIEEAAKSNSQATSVKMVDLMDMVFADRELVNAAPYSMASLLDTTGFLGQKRQEAVRYASLFSVKEEEIERRSAELCNATSYLLAGAQRLGKAPRMDFFIMHLTNLSPLLDAAIHKDWIPTKAKARLLTWFGRFSIILYIAVGSPLLDLTPIRNLKALTGPDAWSDAFTRGIAYGDDGHGIKMVRALAHAKVASGPFANCPEFRMKDTDFEKAVFAVVESFHPPEKVGRAGPDQEEAWVRLAGFDAAWDKVPNIA